MAGFDDNGAMISVNARPRRTSIGLYSFLWQNLSQTITINGISANEEDQIIYVIPQTASKNYWDEYGVEVTEQGLNSLTFTAKSVPTEDIYVYVIVQEVIQS